MANLDYKHKYLELRAKFLDSTNMAYRAGYESGLKDGTKDLQIQQLTQQVADGQAQQQAMMGQQAPGQPGQAPGQEQEGQIDPNVMTDSNNPNQVAYGDDNPNNPAMQEQEGGNELDSAINELSGMVSKGQKPSVTDLRKSLDKVIEIRTRYKIITELKKSEKEESEMTKKVDSILDKWESQKDSTSFENMLKTKGIKL